MMRPQQASDGPAPDDAEPLAEVVQLADKLAEGYTLHHPLRAEIWMEHGEYVAVVPELNVHAFGATRAEALDNVRLAIVEQRVRLLASRPRLSRSMEEEAARNDFSL
jgi:hypothetical protein